MSELERLRAERQARLVALGQRPSWWRPFRRRRWDRKHAQITATSLDETTLMLRRLYPTNLVESLVIQQSSALSFAKLVKHETDDIHRHMDRREADLDRYGYGGPPERQEAARVGLTCACGHDVTQHIAYMVDRVVGPALCTAKGCECRTEPIDAPGPGEVVERLRGSL
ncbi:MAG: hypothetical protein ACTHU0_19215 [Kofleriaceae bacterium]